MGDTYANFFRFHPCIIGYTDLAMKEKSQNHNEGKLRPTLILKDMQEAFEEILKVRENGCKKYSRDNYALSIGTEDEEEFLEQNLDSIFRHLMQYESSPIDKESGCHHLAHVALRCMFGLQYYLKRKK